MTSLSDFSDFMTATDQTVLSGPGDLVNEAVERSYLFRELMKGKPNTEVLQGGKTITDQIMFDEENTYNQVSPNEVFVWQNPQVLDSWSINWRFGLDHMSFTDQEIELQVPAGLTRQARGRIYKEIKAVKERRLVTSMINGLEAELFAAPNNAQMEAASGKKPYSIPFMINEETSGLTTGVTTKQGLDPTTYTKWVPQQEGWAYGSALTDTPNNPIITAFDNMYLDHSFDTLPGYESQSEPRSNATMIVCSKLGLNYYKEALRYGNDTWVSAGRQDPHYGKPMYADIPLVYASQLDTATYIDNSGTFVDESTAAGPDGPRYFWINRKYWKPVFHTRRYMYKHPVRVHPNQPSTHVQVVDCWHNYVTTSLQRHGIVFPNT